MVFSENSVTRWLFHRARPHVLDALSRDRLRVRRVIEDLDRDPASIAALRQCREDRAEVHGAEAGTAALGVVGVEVSRPACVAADQVRYWDRLRGHRLHVLVQRETGMVDALQHLARLVTRIEELGLARREGFQA